MVSLGEIKQQYINKLAERYSENEINIIFYSLAENYLNKDKSQLKLGLHELYEESKIKNVLFQTALYQLQEGVPYQYILGNTIFYGCTIYVTPSVLIPRPETEELVDWVITEHKESAQPTIIDICSGSGCIGIALAKNLPNSKVYSWEIDEQAIEVSKKNAEYNKVNLQYIQSDFLNHRQTPIDTKFDIIISNPPYVRELEKTEMNDSVLKYEPTKALFVSNEDPLIFYKEIIKFAQTNLEAKGKVYVEINQYLAEETQQLFLKYFKKVSLKKDLSGNYRMIKAEY